MDVSRKDSRKRSEIYKIALIANCHECPIKNGDVDRLSRSQHPQAGLTRPSEFRHDQSTQPRTRARLNLSVPYRPAADQRVRPSRILAGEHRSMGIERELYSQEVDV